MKKISYILLSALVGFLLGAFLEPFSAPTEETQPIVKRDTTIVVKYDTITKDSLIEKKTIDTLYIYLPNKPIISLPVVQKHYGVPNYYDVWVSGLEPLKMDSINVYNKIEYRDVVTSVEKEKIINPNCLYGNIGFSSFLGNIYPTMGVSLSLKNKWLISANIGLKNNFSVSVGYKFYSK